MGVRKFKTFSEHWEVVDMGYVTPCWRWLGTTNNTGYGRYVESGKLKVAHAVVYRYFKKHLPVNMQLDHLCRNRICVNPEHLEPVTRTVNLRRGDNTKLTLEQVKEIRNAPPRRGKVAYLAKIYNISVVHVHRIRNNESWVDC